MDCDGLRYCLSWDAGQQRTAVGACFISFEETATKVKYSSEQAASKTSIETKSLSMQ